VVVDDWDMNITHVIRGDDHVNNTPRQINILAALGAPLPTYAHLPMILREDGQKMSKRRDPVSVVDYAGMGFLPEAMLNYLARLGWGHGDAEFFEMGEFVEWFSLEAVSPSPARFNKDKLLWLNQQHIKAANNERLAELITGWMGERECDVSQGPQLADVIALVKERVSTLVELADASVYFYRQLHPHDDVRAQHMTEASLALMKSLRAQFAACDWTTEAIGALIKAFCKEQGVKMGQVGMPVRALVCGTTQTPSVDATQPGGGSSFPGELTSPMSVVVSTPNGTMDLFSSKNDCLTNSASLASLLPATSYTANFGSGSTGQSFYYRPADTTTYVGSVMFLYSSGVPMYTATTWGGPYNP
jgi:glutamyl-tRNA synthetase